MDASRWRAFRRRQYERVPDKESYHDRRLSQRLEDPEFRAAFEREKARIAEEWCEIEVRMDQGSVQISHRAEEGTTVYVSDDDHKWVDPGRIDRKLLAKILREGADALEAGQGDVGRAGGSRMSVCWVKANRLDERPCDGQLVKAHLIPRQRIRKRFPHGAVVTPGGEVDLLLGAWIPDVAPNARELLDCARVSQAQLIADPVTWRWVCGGPMGQGGHHGRIDGRQIRVPRSVIPRETEDWAERFGLAWSLDHDYGAKT